MKTVQEVSNDKLRGGFYTPDSLVDTCINRVVKLSHGRQNLSVLEPSIGDGAFLRRLINHPLSLSIQKFLGIEVIEPEAYKCRQLAQVAPFDTTIFNTSVLEWASTTMEAFDAVLGNPPFVRFQFLSKDDLHAITCLGQRMNLSFRGVGNLWIPVLLGALDRLRPGGVMALVVPAEIFTGLSAGDARSWLLTHFHSLRIDMFEPGSFPDVLQEIVVVSGRRRDGVGQSAEASFVEFAEHTGMGYELRWAHRIQHTTESWTRYLLTPRQLMLVAEAQSLSKMQKLGKVAKLEVSIVTGANDYFSVNAEECERFQLQPWIEPLLPRIRHAEGLIYTQADHAATITSGAKVWLVNFSDDHPDPYTTRGAAEYLEIGKMQKIDARYKTSIRTPWYRVPSMWSGKLFLSKRSHRFPRLIHNEAGVLTTDTIYRGRMLSPYVGQELDLVAGFHNSLTLLTAEIEGRSFGGGVLELVPSEIARLTVPLVENLRMVIPRLDQVARSTANHTSSQELLIEETNLELSKYIPDLTPDVLDGLEQARKALAQRRLNRN